MMPPDTLGPGGGAGKTPADRSPQKPYESWSDYWARTHRNSNNGKARYPWGDDAWPGSDKSQKKYIYRPELEEIAGALRSDLKRYTGDKDPKTESTQQRLLDTFDITVHDFGGQDWDAVGTFFRTISTSQRSMIDAHEAFVASYQDLIRRFEKAAGISQDAEDQSQAAVQKLKDKPDQTY